MLNNHCLDEIENPSLLRLHTKLMVYNFTAVWCKGAINKAPDILSCYPALEPCPAELLAEGEEVCTPQMTIADITALSGGVWD